MATDHVMDPTQQALYKATEFTAFKGKTLAQKVQEIADREEIRDMVARYGIRVVEGRSCADMYTTADDAVFISRGERQWGADNHGRAAVVKTYTALEANAGKGPRFYPLFDNVLIQIDGDNARMLCSVEIQIRNQDKSYIGAGYYENTLRREGGRWKFVRREATFNHFEEVQTV